MSAPADRAEMDGGDGHDARDVAELDRLIGG